MADDLIHEWNGNRLVGGTQGYHWFHENGSVGSPTLVPRELAKEVLRLVTALSAAEDRARRARLEGALEALCEVTGACDTYGSVRLRTEILPRMLAAAERELEEGEKP